MDKKQDKSSLEQQIDDNLRKVFQQQSSQDVPERFLTLLQQLKDQENPK